MDRLIRESNPPAGQVASPVPQVWDPTANGGLGGWARVYGEHNASRVILYGPNGQTIDQDNPLEVRVRALEQLIGSRVENPEQYSLAARVKRLEDLLASGDAKVTLSGSTVDLRGLEANRPAANAVSAGTTYWSIDTGDVSVSDGSTWRSLGVV